MTASFAAPPPAGRPLSGFERYTTSKANIRCPSTVVFLASFPPSASTHLTPERVQQALAHLAQLYPLLRCGISGGRTRSPSYALSSTFDPSSAFALVSNSAASEEEVLSSLANSGLTFNGSRGPLWRVTLYLGAEEGPRLGLAISHVLADGTGTRNLFQHLLSLLHPDSPVDLHVLPPLNEDLPPSFEDTIGVKLTIPAMVKLVRDEIIKPKLKPILPRENKLVPSSPKYDGRPIETSLFRVSAEDVERLKAEGKKHGIATLHPLFQGAVLAACYLASSTPTSSAKPGLIKALTPITLRDPSKGHPFATGDYISAMNTTHKLSASTPFFELCRSYARKLASPKKRLEAIHLMLALSLLDDPKPKPSADLEEGKTYPCTGWDQYLLEYRSGLHKPEGDIAISNLQVLKPTGWEGVNGFELSWAQSVGPYEGPACVNLISLKGGAMSISLNWIGGALEDGDYARRMMSHLEEVLGRVAGGDVKVGSVLGSFRG